MAAALYTAIAEGDPDGAARCLTDDAVLHVPGDNPLAGDHVGPQAILAFAARATEGSTARERLDVLDVLEGQRHAAVYCHVTGSGRDRANLDNITIHLLRLEGGQVAEIWFHNWDQPSVDSFWRSAS